MERLKDYTKNWTNSVKFTTQHLRMQLPYYKQQSKKAIFLGGLKLRFKDKFMAAMSSKPNQFEMYDFVYKEIQSRKRAKHQDSYTGPHWC